jgi:hypothetical protein
LGGPILEDASFTLLLAVFFKLEGVAWSGYALEHRKALSGPWTWMLVSGIVDMTLGFMIVCQLPGTAAWAFGLLVGISMLLSGTAMIAMAVHARGSSPQRAEDGVTTTTAPPLGLVYMFSQARMTTSDLNPLLDVVAAIGLRFGLTSDRNSCMCGNACGRRLSVCWHDGAASVGHVMTLNTDAFGDHPQPPEDPPVG